MKIYLSNRKSVTLSNPELILELHKQLMLSPLFPLPCAMANAARINHAKVFREIPVFKLLPKHFLLS